MLNLPASGLFVDGTLGGGGHTSYIMQNSPDIKVIAIDQDETALSVCRARLTGNIEFVHDNFSNIENILAGRRIDGGLMDLGVSSHQFDEPERGFSYRFDAPLDMRMDRTKTLTAEKIVNTYELDELCRILREYGEERYALGIAKNIIESRPINTTKELVEVIHASLPKKYLYTARKPEKKTFQALRIAVNNELGILHSTIISFANALNSGRRLAIITFHSLEDRIVKNTYKELVGACICPRELPYCVCGYEKKFEIITRKPIIAKKEELEQNPRSHSAKLRVIEKV